ncbi:hypothetical protein IGI37_000922 [Enterococcus sp. AZ194]|uniref:hypothetical protein n=1 Tax=Enterococcus sp. AZ194 TaxID=2774629 RepID=UPI003F2365A8
MGDDYGELLFRRKTVNFAIRITIILILFLCLVFVLGLPTLAGKLIFGALGAYLLHYMFTRGKESVSIYEKAIVLTGGANLVIRKNEVINLSFQTQNVTAVANQLTITQHHYPVLVIRQNNQRKTVQLALPLNRRFEKKAIQAFSQFLGTELVLT